MSCFCIFVLSSQDSHLSFPQCSQGCPRKRSRDADVLYQDMSDSRVWNTLNQTLGNTVTSALLFCSASFFTTSKLVGFGRSFSYRSERHWRNPPISLTKNLFSILFSFLSPIYIYLRNKFTMGYLSKKNANIVQGARENV